jgi:hypothetical protein
MNETFSCDDINSSIFITDKLDSISNENSENYQQEKERNIKNNNNKNNDNENNNKKNKSFLSEKKYHNNFNIMENLNNENNDLFKNDKEKLKEKLQLKDKSKEKSKEINLEKSKEINIKIDKEKENNQDETHKDFKSNRGLFEDSNIIYKEDNQEINNIILQKLNQKNSDLDFEFQESNLNISENLSNNNLFSHYSIKKSDESSDLNSIKNFKIYTKIPYEFFKSKNYSKIACENITTIKIKNKIFSYLTNFINFINNENYFFIKLSKENFLFFLEDFNFYNLNSLKKTKIPYRIYKKFVINMNTKVLDVEFLLRNFKFRFYMKFLGIIIFSFVVFFLALFFFYKFSYRIFHLTAKEIKFIMIIIGFIYIFFLIFLIYNFLFTRKIEYNHIKILMNKKKDLDSLLYKWNSDYFISKMNYIASVPETFEYIQIALRPNKKIELQQHNI